MDMKTKTNKHKVDRDTTYCRWSGVHLSRRLHGNSVLSHCSTQEPAHALSHTLLPSSLSPLTALPFPSLAFPFSMQGTHTEEGWAGMTTKGGTVNCKSLLLSVSFTSMSSLYALLLLRSDWLGNLNQQARCIASWANNLRWTGGCECWTKKILKSKEHVAQKSCWVIIKFVKYFAQWLEYMFYLYNLVSSYEELCHYLAIQACRCMLADTFRAAK